MNLTSPHFATKTEAELRYIIKDAGEAAMAVSNHDALAEGKYLDQIHDAVAVLKSRQVAHVNPNLPLCLVEIANQYGTTVVRPVGICAKTFAEIAGTKTLTSATLRSIQKLGYRIVVESGGAGHGDEILAAFIR